MKSNPEGPWQELLLLARGLEGDRASLERLGRLSEGSMDSLVFAELDYARRTSDCPASFRPARWRRALHKNAARFIPLSEEIHQLSTFFRAGEIAWAPFKGIDTATRFYPTPDQRPMADLDILVRKDQLDLLRGLLEDHGYQSIFQGVEAERYMASEGYCWSVKSPSGVLVELHFRLWGFVPEGCSDEMLRRAVAHPELKGGLQLEGSDAWLLTACHSWLDRPPRSIRGWRDLEHMALSLEEDTDLTASVSAEAIVERAVAWDLQLPVAAAALTAHRLFHHPFHLALVERLSPTLRMSERLVMQRLERDGPQAITFRQLALARLLARRRSRSGLRSIYRRIWPHRSTIQRESGTNRPLAGRMTHTLQRFRRTPS